VSDEKQIYEFGAFCLDTGEKQLRRISGEVLPLPPKAFDLLRFLVENNGRLLDKNELLDGVWADSFVEEGNLKLNVHTLRKVLDESGEKFIETIPRRGYRFNADVKSLRSNELIVEKITHSKLVVKESDYSEKLPQLAGQSKTKNYLRFSLLLTVIFAVSGLAYFVLLRPKADASKIVANNKLTTIAVLPFKNLTKDTKDDFLSVGLTDALITKLSSVNNLAVRPTSAVLPFAASQDTPQKIGENLKVETVLDGTIQRVNDRLRVSLQLINISTNQVLWAGNFDEDEQNLLKFQDAFSRNIMDALRFKLSGEQQTELAHRDTENPEVYRLYLTARYFFSQNRGDSIVKAVELYEQAVKLDDRYALAYIGIGESYMTLGESAFGAIPPAEAYQKATAAAQKALAINPNLAEAYMILGNAQIKHEWNIEAGDSLYRKAIALNPNFARVHLLLAWNLMRQSRFEEAEVEMRRAAELNPTSLEIAAESGYPAFFAGDYNKAILLFGQAVEFDKNLISARLSLCRALQHAGRYDEAWKEVEAVEKNIGRGIPLIEMVRGRTLALQGKTAEAREIYDTLVSRKQKGEYISPLYLAILAADMNDREAVFGWLDESYKERNDYLLQLSYAPEFTRFHDDPRFQELLAKIKPFPPN
jgi:DNA-binding winged helix-turn-helix (wHTH) protein/TolB-like protein/cytochrome c-type biogenesis protein CcmH/NrfG